MPRVMSSPQHNKARESKYKIHDLDIQLFCDTYACIMYICTYITKCSCQNGYSEQIKNSQATNSCHTEVSAQEASYQVSQYPEIHTSVLTTIIIFKKADFHPNKSSR